VQLETVYLLPSAGRLSSFPPQSAAPRARNNEAKCQRVMRAQFRRSHAGDVLVAQHGRRPRFVFRREPEAAEILLQGLCGCGLWRYVEDHLRAPGKGLKAPVRTTSASPARIPARDAQLQGAFQVLPGAPAGESST